MKRIKMLGSAVAMALALTVVAGVASASANYFEAVVSPATWSGSLTGAKHEVWTGPELFYCGNTSFVSGEAKGNTYEELTVSPELNSCTHNSYTGPTVGWEMNGCQFRFHAGPGPALNGTMDIINCAKPMTNNTSGCITEIGNQFGLGTPSFSGNIHYENVVVGEHTVKVTATIENFTYTRSGKNCIGALGTFSDGEYSGSWTVKAETSGVQAWVSVKSTSAPIFENFRAEEAPVTISASRTTGTKVNYLGANIGLNCATYSLNGTSSTASTESITVTPTFKNCAVEGVSVPDSNVSAGGCSYVLHANGVLDIAGATCASNPMTITRPGCTSTVGPQSGIVGLKTFNINEGSGKFTAVGISGEGANFTYTNVGASCSKVGTLSNGKVRSLVMLTGANSKAEGQGFWLQ